MPKHTAALPDWELVLSSTTRLQRVLPDAVLVGRTASALHAEHRFSRDADHLRVRFDQVLAELESVADWKTARVLRSFDRLYHQPNGESSLQRLQVQLANAMLYVLEATELGEYKSLHPRWHDWRVVQAECSRLATAIFDRVCDTDAGDSICADPAASGGAGRGVAVEGVRDSLKRVCRGALGCQSAEKRAVGYGVKGQI